MKLLSYLPFTLLLFALTSSFLGATVSTSASFNDLQSSMGPEISIDNPDTITICRGDTILLTQTNNVENAGLTWRMDAGFLSASTDPTARIVPVVSQFYKVTVSNDDGEASDSVYVNVNQLIIPTLINDTTVCEGTALPLVQGPVENGRGTRYRYVPAGIFDNAMDANSLVTPRTTQSGFETYTLISTSADSICADTQFITIGTTPSRLEISEEDTVFRCNNEEPLQLNVVATPSVSAGNITWFPNEGIIDRQANGNIEVGPMNDRTYFVTAEVNGCPQIDSVHIRVDSLPDDLSLTSQPEKDPFCPGDTFNLRGTIFDVGDFPLIIHDWTVAPGIQSPEDLYQGTFIAQDSMLYERVTTNGACVDTATIQINVIKPPMLIFDPDPALACPGEPLQVNVTFDPTRPSGTLEWMDPEGTLSCTDCLDPIVTTDQSVAYQIEVIAEGSECPFPASYEVPLFMGGEPILTTQTTVCLGDDVLLITGNVRTDEGYTYTISGGGQMLMDPTGLVRPTETTTYTIQTRNPAFGPDSQCGAFTQEITINVAESYEVFLDAPSVVCVGERVDVSVRVVPPTPGSLVITLPDGATFDTPEASFVLGETSEVSVRFVDAAGCDAKVATATIMVEEQTIEPVIIASTTSGMPLTGTTVFAGTEIDLTVGGLPDGFEGTINWVGISPSTNPPTAAGRTITTTAPGGDNAALFGYTVTVVPTNDGCPATANITLTTTEEPFQIPEIISANRDGLNDDFQVFFSEGTPVEDFNLLVYNRFGQEVYSSSNFSEGWDGTKDGSPQNIGTYLFLTKFSIAGQAFEREGQFSLVR